MLVKDPDQRPQQQDFYRRPNAHDGPERAEKRMAGTGRETRGNRAHITGVDDSGLLNMEIWGSRFDGNSWKEFLKEGLTASERDHIRMATRTGRPLGTDDFVRQLEKVTGRSLRPRKPGPKSRLSSVSSGVE